MSDYAAIGTALAARFAAGAMTAPTGYRAIRLSTATAPNQLPTLPVVIVSPESGEYETGTGTRLGVHKWSVRFYYDQLTDLTRSQAGLQAWLTVLADQLKGAVQLGGVASVTRATIDGYQLGTLHYAGVDYAGIEFSVTIVTAEAWAAVA